MTMTETERSTSPSPDAAPKTAPPAIPATTAVAATFTIEGIAEPLAFMLEAAGLEPKVAFAPYNQVFQELLSPAGVLGSNQVGTNVVLVRLQDFVRDAAPGTDLAAALENVAREFLDASIDF